MLPYETTRIRWVDVLNGAKRAWSLDRGDVLAAGAALAALILVLVFGNGSLALGLVLVAGVLLNASRILYRAVAFVHQDRDYDAYIDALLLETRQWDPAGWAGPKVEYMRDRDPDDEDEYEAALEYAGYPAGGERELLNGSRATPDL